MANRFWVGSGSANTWAATANTNWATTSGGANNASVPTTTDVAVFDSNSGVGNSVIGASITVQGLDCTGGTGNYAGTITHNTGVTLTINTGAATSLRLASGMTYTPASTTSLITFTHTTGTAQITSAGKTFTAITINGAGGTTQQQDDLSISAILNSILTITAGIFDANGHATTAYIVSSNNANTRSLILGTSMKIGGNVSSNSTIWNLASGTLTFTKNSSGIEILTPFIPVEEWVFAGNGLTYNALTVDATTTNSLLGITGSNTFSSVSLGSGWSLLPAGNSTTTISAAFTWAGTQTSPMLVMTASLTQLATISCPSGACTLAWGGLFGITVSGGATFTASNTFNFGNNTGWAISPPADATSAGIAAAVWRDTTAGDFTVAGSIGKDLFLGGVTPGAAGGHFIAGANAATSVTTAFTANITGNLSGSVGSVTGNVGGNVVGSVASVTARVTANSDQLAGQTVTAAAGVTFPTSVASPTNITAGTITTTTNLTNAATAGDLTATMKTSVTTAATAATPTAAAVTGNVGGNVVGSVASVTSRVTANSDQLAGSATAATNLSGNALATTVGVVDTGATTTSIPTSSLTPPGAVANQFGSNIQPRYLIFDKATATAALRNQSTSVSATTNAANPTFTVNPLTTAPAAGDTFRLM